MATSTPNRWVPPPASHSGPQPGERLALLRVLPKGHLRQGSSPNPTQPLSLSPSEAPQRVLSSSFLLERPSPSHRVSSWRNLISFQDCLLLPLDGVDPAPNIPPPPFSPKSSSLSPCCKIKEETAHASAAELRLLGEVKMEVEPGGLSLRQSRGKRAQERRQRV